MALRDAILDGLRSVFGADREARRDAESPSAAALAAQPSSMFSSYGRDELGGMLSVSQVLLDRYADYEAMEEYPDIGCLAEGTLVYVFDGSIVKPVPIETIAIEGEGLLLLAFDVKRQRVVKVMAQDPRLTAVDADVIKLQLSNGRTIRCTKDHKFLTVDGYMEAKELTKGALLIGMFAGFNTTGTSFLVEPRWGKLELTADPVPDGKAKVYDITTETHNFIVEGVVAHNSAFRYFANDAVQPSITDGRVIWTVSDDDAIKGVCDDLLHKTLRSEYELWSQTYSLDSMGNDFEELLVTENGVVGLNHLPAATMRRVEALDGSLIGYVQDITGQFSANSHELRAMLAGNIEIPKSLALFEDWQVVHFRLRATRRRSPYGVSVAEGARAVWKRLIMMEDASVIYWLNRVPRYAFYVDATDVPPDRVEGFLKKMKRDLKKKKMVNPATGRLDMRYKPLSNDEDFVIGVREGRDLARVEVVSAPEWTNNESLDYFKRMLHGTLNVPRAWLGQDDPIPSKSPLCLTGDTQVPLMDGRKLTMEQLAADYSDREFYVYSIGPDGRVVPGRAHSPQLTRPNAEVWEVELDNGEKVRGTPDHPFMLRDGSYRRLDELQPGDGLMPLYRHCIEDYAIKLVGSKPVGRADCYDFTVEGVHNFAISAGIFVHNSNDDVRAARVTLNLQQEIKLGYERICRVHLAARGVKNPYEPEFTIQMTVPSGIYELAAYEVLNARADYAQRIAPFTSIRWVQENVMHLGEAEIDIIEKQRKKEQEEGLNAGGMGGPGGGMGGMTGPPPPMAPAPHGAEMPEGGFHGQAIPEAPSPNAPQREWKAYDNGRRLEEMRHRQSQRNHQLIMDRLGQLLENDDTGFALRHRERSEFFKALKQNAFSTVGGHLRGAPPGRGHGTAHGANGTNSNHR